MATLDNKERLPLFITATCDFSVYDDPDQITAGEVLITNPNGERLPWSRPQGWYFLRAIAS